MRNSLIALIALVAVAGTTLSACGPAVFGAGVAVGLRGLAERSTKTVASDTRIRVEANNTLQQNASAHYSRIGVEVFEGRVLLTGTIATEADKAHVGDLVAALPNVQDVINEIRIGNTGDVFDYARDVAIASAIRLRLIEQNKTSEKLDFEIEVVDRIVYILGIAQDETTINEVAEIAGSVAGVEAVVLHILLYDDPSRPANQT